MGRGHVALPVLCPAAWEKLLLTCLFGVLYFSLSAALETNKLQGKELELGNELMASSDARVRNTQLSGREGVLRSEHGAVLGRPSSVPLKWGSGGGRQRRAQQSCFDLLCSTVSCSGWDQRLKISIHLPGRMLQLLLLKRSDNLVLVLHTHLLISKQVFAAGSEGKHLMPRPDKSTCVLSVLIFCSLSSPCLPS